MVELHTPALDAVFHALGDGTRRQMLQALASGEQTVGGLAAPFAISFAAASKHIRVLERAGLVQRAVAGRTHRLWLAPEPLTGARQWLGSHERFWSGRLDVLERLLREDAARSPRLPRPPSRPPPLSRRPRPTNPKAPSGDQP